MLWALQEVDVPFPILSRRQSRWAHDMGLNQPINLYPSRPDPASTFQNMPRHGVVTKCWCTGSLSYLFILLSSRPVVSPSVPAHHCQDASLHAQRLRAGVRRVEQCRGELQLPPRWSGMSVTVTGREAYGPSLTRAGVP